MTQQQRDIKRKPALPRRIAWCLQRYHGLAISNNGVYGVLKRAGLSRLPANCRKRSIVSKRYEKQAPATTCRST